MNLIRRRHPTPAGTLCTKVGERPEFVLTFGAVDEALLNAFIRRDAHPVSQREEVRRAVQQVLLFDLLLDRCFDLLHF